MAAVETLICSEDAIPSNFEDPEPWQGQDTLPRMSMDDWMQLQEEDEDLRWVVTLLREDRKPELVAQKEEPLEVCVLLRE